MVGISIGIITAPNELGYSSRAEDILTPEEIKQNSQLQIPSSRISGQIRLAKDIYNSLDKTKSLVVTWCDIEDKTAFLDCPRQNWDLIKIRSGMDNGNDLIYEYDFNIPNGRKGITLLSYAFSSMDEKEGELLSDNHSIVALDCKSKDTTGYKQDCILDNIQPGSFITQNFEVKKSVTGIDYKEIIRNLPFQLLSSDDPLKIKKYLEQADVSLLQTLVGSNRNGIIIDNNSDYRELLDIIQAGIDVYKNEDRNRKVYYQTSRKDKIFYNSLLKKFTDDLSPFSPISPIINSERIKLSLSNLLDDETRNVIWKLYEWSYSYLDFLIPNSSLYMQIEDRLVENGENRYQLKQKIFTGSIGNDKLLFTKGAEIFNQWVKTNKDFLEGEYKEDLPVSTSKIISHYLKENDGNLSKSLWDTAIFFKILARYNHVDNQPLYYRKNLIEGIFLSSSAVKSAEYTATYIKDEFGKVNNFNFLKKQLDRRQIKSQANYYDNDKDLSLVNQVGTPYHKLYLVALLSYLPPEIVKYFASADTLFSIDEYGIVKTEVNIDAISSLDKINQYLLTLPQEP